MRICFISRRYFPAISGMSIYAVNLLKQLVAAGHDVTMISQYRGDEFGRSVYGGGPPPLVDGVRVIGLEQIGEQENGDFESDINTIVETIIAEHSYKPFDILHAQYGYPTGWATILASQITGVPNIVSIQGGDGHWVGSCCKCHRLAMERVLDHAGAVLIGGNSFAKEVHERLGTPMSRFTLIPGAVDTRHFKPAGPCPQKNTKPVGILYHGRVDRRKGVLDFIEALALLLDISWMATISGIGPDLDAAIALAAEKGLENRITFSGYADYNNVPSIYQAHQIFASPTYAEGFSNTILEAMANGHAIVSCRSVGVIDCLRHEVNSLLVDAGDIPAQASALRSLIVDDKLRTNLGHAALEECRATYSWEIVGHKIMNVYTALAGTSPDLSFDTVLPQDPCRFRAEPHLL